MEEKYRKILAGDTKDPNYPARDYELSYDDKYGIYEKLLEIPFYQKVPHMMPFIGSRYEKTESRILLVYKSFSVGELINEDKQLNYPPEDWYNASQNKLDQFLNYKLPIEDDMIPLSDWINIRGHLTKGNRWVWYQMADEIIKHYQNNWGEIPDYKIINSSSARDQKRREFIYQHIAFMNYFLRPGTGEILKNPAEIDKEKSYDVFTRVIGALKPTIIFFFGVGSYSAISAFNKYRKKHDDNNNLFHNIEIKSLYSVCAWTGSKPHMLTSNLPDLIHKHQTSRTK